MSNRTSIECVLRRMGAWGGRAPANARQGASWMGACGMSFRTMRQFLNGVS